MDERVFELLEMVERDRISELAPLIILGLNHEQQHQELLLTDIKYNFSINPLKPAFHSPSGEKDQDSSPGSSLISSPFLASHNMACCS